MTTYLTTNGKTTKQHTYEKKMSLADFFIVRFFWKIFT
jgi:hypothetical protein